MRKIYLSVLLSFATVAVFAQLQNTSFENWTTSSYDDPAGWDTGNRQSASSGLVPVTRTTGHNGYAVRMQTIISNSGDTAQAYIANGDPMQGKGGMPISGQPTAITGWFRYGLPNNDSALILLVFKNNGAVFNTTVFKIRGTGSQNTFASFSYPISLSATPDSVIFAAASSNLIDNVGVEDGSFLELDGIAFTGVSSPIDNNEFENWTTQTNYSLNSWETYGEGVSRTTDSHDGTYAISLTTIDYGNGDFSSSGMTTGHNTQSGPVGGTPFSLQSDTLTGWYKYSTPCTDTGYASISTTSNGSNVGGQMIHLVPVSQYTYFEIPINSFSTPDTMRIDISSSQWPYTNSCGGSTLIIDQIAMKSDLVAAINKIEDRTSPFAFPNPATKTVHINGGNKMDDKTIIEVYDLAGRMVMKETKEQNSDDAINISILQKGRYYYRQTSSRGDSMNSFIKQ